MRSNPDTPSGLSEELTAEKRLLTFISGTSGMTATDRYLSILGFMHGENPKDFASVVLNFDRYSRVYFARSRAEIDASGRSTQPSQIPNADLWALTNMRAEQKQEWLKRVAAALGYRPAVLSAIDEAGKTK